MEHNITEPCGILVVNKPSGITSFDVVHRIRKLYGTKRVGHTGTLDPLAQGVLVVLVGRAAKAAEYISSDTKQYRATFRLGLRTDTQDITGTITSSLPEDTTLPATEDVLSAVHTFEGQSEQIPPLYSAVKIGGKKLYQLAREGVEIERAARPITVYSINAAVTDSPAVYSLEVECSAGTYIRTLISDIGDRLGVGAAMLTLERTRAGYFSLEDAYTLEQLENLPEEQRQALLLPLQDTFCDLPAVHLPDFYNRLCRNGCEIYQKKISTSFPTGQRVRLFSPDSSFWGLGEVREFPDGSAIKAIKVFEI